MDNKIDISIPKNLPLLLKKRTQEKSYYPLQVTRNQHGDYTYHSYGKVYDEVLALAYGLDKIGLTKEDKVGVIADNRREWLVSDFAVLSLGACNVPRGCDSMGKEILFILQFAKCNFCIFENEKQYLKIKNNIDELPFLKKIIFFDAVELSVKNEGSEKGIEIYNYEEILAIGRCKFEDYYEECRLEIEGKMEKVESNDLATIIFTSGTTGVPKGVMLTHENFLVQLSVINDFVTIRPGEMWINMLPIWHSYERVFQYIAIYRRSGMTYSKPVAARILQDMKEIQPRWMCAVPRLWEAIWQSVTKDIRKKGGKTLKRFNFFLAFSKQFVQSRSRMLGQIACYNNSSRLYDVLLSLLPLIISFPFRCIGDFLYFRSLREKLGGKFSVAVSGGGSLPKDIEDCFKAIGINMLEAYGMSETAPLLAMKKPSNPIVGCIGEILPSMEIKIVAHENGVIIDGKPLPPGKKGLVCARGKQVMKGYYLRPDLTKSVIDDDGWLSTGDVGVISLEGGLKITGRAKDTIVLMGGENIEPRLIEAAICESGYIDTAVVFGQDQRYIAALIIPNEEMIIQYAMEKDVSFTFYEDLLEKPEIENHLRMEISKKVCGENGFRACERINKFVCLATKFSVGDELSAKQELIRFRIAEKYKKIVKKLFA